VDSHSAFYDNDPNHAVAASDLTIGKRAIRNSRALDGYLASRRLQSPRSVSVSNALWDIVYDLDNQSKHVG
jgi:hypothetical protein